MKPGVLHQFFIFILACCFTVSATETDIGSIHQTFFDDYDTYIQGEQQYAPQDYHFEQQRKQDGSQIGYSFLKGILYTPNTPICFKTGYPSNSFPPSLENRRKLFLLQSVWRI